jgi:hypothetical protein
MKPVSRRLFFAELLERVLDTGLGLAGHQFRTIEELADLPLSTVLGIIPARNPQCSLVTAAGALWQAGSDGEKPCRVIELSPVEEAILNACDGSRRLADLVPSPPATGSQSAVSHEELKAAFVKLVRAGVLIPAAIPSGSP